MTKPDDSVVRFACPRCFLRLKAPLVQVGTGRRCPRCQFVFEVPTPARAARRSRNVGEYRLSEGAGPSPAEDQPHVTVSCPVCSTRIRAAESQVGRQVTCPDCDTPVVVTPPAEVEKKSTPPVPVEEYALCDDAEWLALRSRPADQTYVSVTCPVCETFMKVPEDQVGHEIECPDCRQPMVVPPPPETGREKSTPAEDPGEYALHEEGDGPPAGVPAAEQTDFSVHCPLCDTLMYVGRDQVGWQIVCRDCETEFVVPRPPAPKRKLDLQARSGDVYGVGESIEVPEYRPVIQTSPRRSRPGLPWAADGPPQAQWPHTHPPPRWTFFSGVFGFPAYRNSWPRWVGLSLGLILPLLVGQFAFSLAMAPAGPWAAAVPWIAAMVLAGLTAVFVLIWAVIAFVSCLSILRDTADGYHQIENWPEPLFLDWIGEFFFLTNSLAVSMLSGLAIGSALEPAGVERGLSVSVTMLLVFPVSLMAMLETNSALNPFSLPVWRSLLSRWWAWGLFYIETTVLIAAVGALTMLAAIYVPVVGLALAAPLLVAVLMVYFRLLGRLAWRCGEGADPDKRKPARQ